MHPPALVPVRPSVCCMEPWTCTLDTQRAPPLLILVRGDAMRCCGMGALSHRSKNTAYEPPDLKAQRQTAGASAGGDGVEEITGMGAADSRPDDSQAPLATLSVGSVRSSGQLVEENSYKELSTWRGLLEKLIGLLDRSNEYIEVFGIPIDTTFRNAIFSLAFTGIAAGMSSLISFVVKGRNDNGG